MQKEADQTTKTMPSIFSRDTYVVDEPLKSSVIRGFFIFLTFLLILTGIAQWVGQSALAVALPPPIVDEDVPSFSVKLNYLDAFVRQHGKVDCLLFGSSHIHNGLDPAVVAQTYHDQTGYEIHCFNFGLGTLTTDTAGPVLNALVKRYRPRLVVFEVSARSFSSEFGGLTRPLQESAWVQYQNGDRSLEGWALDHFYAYRYYLALKTWQYPYNRSVMLRNWRESNELGFAPIAVIDSMQETSIQDVKFEIEGTNWDGFLQLLSLQGQTQLVILEAPIQETYLPRYLAGGVDVYENEFIQPVRQELLLRNIPFWRGVDEVSPLLSTGMWYDERHVNLAGAQLFSRWLGQKMAQEFSPGLFQ